MKRLLEYDLDGGFWVQDTLAYDESDPNSIPVIDHACYKYLPTAWKELSHEVVIKHQGIFFALLWSFE